MNTTTATTSTAAAGKSLLRDFDWKPLALVPALALLDAVARLQPGVLNAPSHEQDSFSDGLLEGPAYSRPEVLPDGRAVPQVLLSGHHAQIARWRRERALELTARRRPDLIEAARVAGRLSPADEAFLSRLRSGL